MKILKAFWKRLKNPSKAAAGVVLFLGFAGGLLFWGAFNTGMEATNTEEFCSGCHAPIVKEIKRRSTTLTVQAFVQSVLTVTYHMNGQIRSYVKFKRQKNCLRTTFLAPLIHQRSSKLVVAI